METNSTNKSNYVPPFAGDPYAFYKSYGYTFTPTEKTAITLVAIQQDCPESYVIACCVKLLALYKRVDNCYMNFICDITGLPGIDTSTPVVNTERLIYNSVQRYKNNYKKYELRQMAEHMFKTKAAEQEKANRQVITNQYFDNNPGLLEFLLNDCYENNKAEIEINNEHMIYYVNTVLAQAVNTPGYLWRVYNLNYNSGYLSIGMIEEFAGKETPTKVVKYEYSMFGMTFDLRFDYRAQNLNDPDDERDNPTCSVGSMGSFNVAAATGTTSERCSFYIGLGQILANNDLVADIERHMIKLIETNACIVERNRNIMDYVNDPVKFTSTDYDISDLLSDEQIDSDFYKNNSEIFSKK